MAVAPVRKLFTVSEYHTMVSAGILGEDDRFELIEGEILAKSPIGRRHLVTVNRLTGVFASLVVGKNAIVSVQNPLTLEDLSEPQPDMTLFRYREDFYSETAATVADVLLVVEVADSSPDFDRRFKGPLYAGSGITEFWLVDLANRILEVNRQPAPGGYREVRRLLRGENVSPLAFPELVLSANEILG